MESMEKKCSLSAAQNQVDGDESTNEVNIETLSSKPHETHHDSKKTKLEISNYKTNLQKSQVKNKSKSKNKSSPHSRKQNFTERNSKGKSIPNSNQYDYADNGFQNRSNPYFQPSIINQTARNATVQRRKKYTKEPYLPKGNSSDQQKIKTTIPNMGEKEPPTRNKLIPIQDNISVCLPKRETFVPNKGFTVKQKNKTSKLKLSKNKPPIRNLLLPKKDSVSIQHSKRKIIPMSLLELKKLSTKCNKEVLLTILDNESGFSLLYNQKVKHDSMVYVLLALGKAVESSMDDNNITALIVNVTHKNYFFLFNLQQYLASFQVSESNEHYLDSLLSLSEFLLKFQILLPSSAADVLFILLPLLKLTCEKYLNSHKKFYSAFSLKLQEIEEKNLLVREKCDANEIKQISPKEKLQLMNPTESYRSIPVLHNSVDLLHECAFLRPNIVKGKYQDTEHYLDVQYRLLREDYVKPLRDGITAYLKLKKLGKPIKHCKDVRVYLNVHIVKQKFVNGDLFHIAQFNDKSFSKIKWAVSKRFLTGSLLCLTSDDFTTMLFATIAHRDSKELKKGLLLVHFEELTDEILNLGPLVDFTVIETSAYFEAYRYNLKALQELNESTLPMKQYIIETQKNVQKPLYLKENTKYDIRPLLLPLNCENLKDEINKLNSNISKRAKSINIFNTNSWPTSNELNLNPSQLTALKAAVTKEFAVIQGPPGTGKTYVSLRIAQLLLYNISKWQSDTSQLPILVICRTNHALDQFLEGLLLFTKKLVRVGGGGNSKALFGYQLRNLKSKIINNKKHKVLPDVFSGVKQMLSDINDLKTYVSEIENSIANSLKTVLSENKLVNYMPKKHYCSLKSLGRYPEDNGLMIHIWLGIYTNSNNKVIRKNSQAADSTLEIRNKEMLTSVVYPSLESDLYNETESDIEDISDEFVDLSYDFPEFGDKADLLSIYEDTRKLRGNKASKKQVAMESEELQQYVIYNLQNNPTMSENCANKVDNVWDLEFQDRWCLYKYWLDCYNEKKNKKHLKLQEELRIEYKQLREMRSEEDLYVCKQAQVVGMTTTGAAKYRHIVQQLNPRILIVEEAAEILESHIVTSLASGTQHVILIGDHQQLQPSPTVHLLAVKYDLNVSLFERMLQNGMDCYKLTIQHRMRPEIAALVSPYIYNELDNHESVSEYDNIKGVGRNVFFISHTFNELQEYGSKSKVNQHEAKFMIKLCKYFILQGYKPSQITVLTTYSGQLLEMKRLCSDSIPLGVKFTVVDNYQGEENDIILISFVRSNEEGQIGFLKVSNRVCVALSRAKKGLFCIGNFKLLAEKSGLWESIVGQLEKDAAVGPSLQLVCQNHPDVINLVATEKDFDSVPDGGCNQKCEFSLLCGHVCSLMCHPYDVEHEKFQCQEPCSKYCSQGHLCQRKCYQYCGNCKVMVSKLMENCGHTIEVHCYEKNNKKTLCTLACDKYLSCGHICPSICSDICPLKCVEKVNVRSKVCGHKVIIECSDFENEDLLTKSCREPCRVELSCGHMCKGTCSRCHQGRLHTACDQPCDRILVCGHKCQSLCSKSCPPCKYPCENWCIHNKCSKKCGETCKKCTEQCEWSCQHKQCNRLCSELCDRTACDEPCPKVLVCQHPCIGYCGEPCPIECRVCDEEKLKEMLSVSEKELDVRFILLEDCKHIFELSDIAKWMNIVIEEKREVQLKECPKCKMVIRKNLRFGNTIKDCLVDLEKVKRKICWSVEKSIKYQQALIRSLKNSVKFWDLSLICKPLIDALSFGKIRDIQRITTMENSVHILLVLLHVAQSSTMRTYIPLSRDNVIQIAVTKLEAYMSETEKWLTDFISKTFLTASELQLQELTWELHRLKLANKLLVLMKKYKIQSNMCFTMVECLVTHVPFREEETKKFTIEFEKFMKFIIGVKINISELEKKSILKSTSLSKGYWYQCPNGHVYCISEYGGATKGSKCNECAGNRHTLLDNNLMATAIINGTQHST